MRTKTVAVRVRDEEFAHFDHAAEVLGVRVGAWFRVAGLEKLKRDGSGANREPAEPLPLGLASRFSFEASGLSFTIERYDNHGRLLPNGKWCVACWFSKGDCANVWYLGAQGWTYKSGDTYDSAEQAWAAYRSADQGILRGGGSK